MITSNMTQQDLDSITLAQRLKRRGWPDGIILGELRQRGCTKFEARRIVAGVDKEEHFEGTLGALKRRLKQ